MTDNNFTEKDLSFDTLFGNGVCLTYNPFAPSNSFHYALEVTKKYCYQHNVKRALIKSKAELSCEHFTQRFHYFSNGILIHDFDQNNENDCKYFQNVLEMFTIRKLVIHKIYAIRQIFDYWRAKHYMRNLSEHANLLYPYKEDISITEFPKLENFVKECFANGNILLTACKNENVNPKIREYAALFADGRYYLSEEYSGAPRRFNEKYIGIFEREHKNNVFLRQIFVPKEYISAIYKEAEKHKWFISATDMEYKNRRSDKETNEMNHYIANLFNGRKCLSVTNLEYNSATHFSADPDVDKYALFSDGTLVLGNSRQNLQYSSWLDLMKSTYKDMNFRIEQVPDYYIPAIYAALPDYQRSAGNIYLEMLKEKAKKLKVELKLTHHEALDLAAKIDGWENFKSIKIDDESHARHLISAEKWRNRIAGGSFLREYKLYLKNLQNK